MNNVLFLLIDCLRADKCWGRRTAKTPTINSLRRNGVVFSQAISAATFTNCSVASILTGSYSPKHGIRTLTSKLNPRIETLSEIFRKNGYNTYAEVTGPLLPETGLNKGFDEFTHRNENEHVHSRWGDFLLEKFRCKEFREPWFVFIHFWELHGPRRISNEFDINRFGRNIYERALSSLDSYLKKLLSNINGSKTIVLLLADHGEGIAETMVEQRFYHIQSRIFKRLFRKTSTYWWMTRNVGLMRKEGHGYGVDEHLLRVPLIFVGKKIFPSNKVIKDQVSQVDILPTIKDALGLRSSSDIEIDGRSLMPLIKGENIPEGPVFCECPHERIHDGIVGIRTSKYKFVYTFYNNKEELYDIENDQHEKKNIIKKKPEIAQKLKKILEEKYIKANQTSPLVYLPEKEDRILEKLRSLGYL